MQFQNQGRKMKQQIFSATYFRVLSWLLPGSRCEVYRLPLKTRTPKLGLTHVVKCLKKYPQACWLTDWLEIFFWSADFLNFSKYHNRSHGLHKTSTVDPTTDFMVVSGNFVILHFFIWWWKIIFYGAQICSSEREKIVWGCGPVQNTGWES